MSPFAFRVILELFFLFHIYEAEESNIEADGHGRTLI